MKGITVWEEAGPMKEGGIVSMTRPTWTKRRWWQFWKPRWIEGPTETRSYRIVGPSITSARR